MRSYEFNRNPIRLGASIEVPSDQEIRVTPSLFRASLEDALMYGGDLTRVALGVMDIKGDRKHIVVDTKVHMLMPGMWPAIPGWHTDAVPRHHGVPSLENQEDYDAMGFKTHFHLLVTGEGCLTDFLIDPMTIRFRKDIGTDLYEDMTKVVNGESPDYHEVPSCTVVEWDWWNIHRAKAAQKREWRFLIRVTETDYQKPNSDLRDILRTQQQVYVPSEAFGW